MPYSNYNYISLISLLLDDDINPKVVDIYNWEGFTDVMGLMGRYKESKQPVFHDYVNADIGVQVTAESVSGSPGTTLTVVVTALTTGLTAKDVVFMFPNGKAGHVQSVTTASDKDSLSIKTVDGTNLTLAAGQKLDAFTQAVGEASIAPTNLRRSLTKYVNNIQIVRGVNEETDVAKVSLLRVDFNGQAYFYAKNLIEKLLEHKGRVNGMCIGGRISTTLFSDTSPALVDPDGGGAVQLSRGLDQYATTYGITDAVTTPNTWTLADHSDVIDQLLANRAIIANYKLFMSSKVKGKVDDHLKNLGSSNVNSVRLTAEAGSTTKLNFWVDRLNYKGMNADLTVMPILDNNKMFSQTDIIKSIYYMPEDSVNTLDGGRQPRVQMRYQSHGVGPVNKGDKIWGEWHSGPLSPVSPAMSVDNDRAIWRTNWKTHQGVEVLGAQHLCKSVVLS
jgi:hypothetical protein